MRSWKMVSLAAIAAAFVGLATAPSAAATALLRGQVSSAYIQDTAIEYVWMSAAAYCAKNTIENWDCGTPCSKIGMEPGSITVAENSTHNVQAFVSRRTDGDAILSFRGTEPSSLKDWIDDLKYAKQTPFSGCSGCHVHGGFYNAYIGLKPQIMAGLQNIGIFQGTSTPVHITGHSLGAAMAALAAYDLKMTGYTIGDMFTFGEPRVGDKAFAASFAQLLSQNRLYRVVHYRDIVPHLPLELMGFHHVPTEVWYNEDSTSYQVCNGSGEDPSCSDSLDIAISISDHLHYINIPISGSCSVSSFEDSVPPPGVGLNGAV